MLADVHCSCAFSHWVAHSVVTARQALESKDTMHVFLSAMLADHQPVLLVCLICLETCSPSSSLLVGAGDLFDGMRYDVDIEVDESDECQFQSGMTMSVACMWRMCKTVLLCEYCADSCFNVAIAAYHNGGLLGYHCQHR